MKKPCLTFGFWSFSPGLISSLTTLLLLPLLVYLGFWQLHRFEEKQNNQQDLVSRMNESIITISQTDEINKIRYRQLQVTGTFLNEYPILLDNQILEGQAGYRVMVPFLPLEDKQILLIDRGWIPLGKNRTEFPVITPIVGKISLIGTINLPSFGLQLKKSPESPINQIAWPLRVQRIEFQVLSQIFSRSLYPFVLQLNPQDPHGFKIPPITLNIPANRHLGYAIQWFAMAMAVFIYYLVINSRRTYLHS